MFRFLRTLRRKLLDEEKIRTYFWYAFGEILLVMIGILLALQVNNWNEERKLQEEIEVYLIKKLDDLYEDQRQLEELIDFRSLAEQRSRSLLDTGIKETDVFDAVSTLTFISVERRFVTAVERTQGNNTIYRRNIENTTINDLEKNYLNVIEIITFEENRLNTFSENQELGLWRGFFTNNRQLFASIIDDVDRSTFEDKTPTLKMTDEDQSILEGLLHRTVIASPSLVSKYIRTIEINKSLVAEIEEFLN